VLYYIYYFGFSQHNLCIDVPYVKKFKTNFSLLTIIRYCTKHPNLYALSKHLANNYNGLFCVVCDSDIKVMSLHTHYKVLAMKMTLAFIDVQQISDDPQLSR
jgi:hypothetical protein